MQQRIRRCGAAIASTRFPWPRAHRRPAATTLRRQLTVELLESRQLLSASPINGRPYFDLGPSDGVAWDQPRVTVQFIDELERIVGPTTFNTWLLDTGANTILAFQTAVGDMVGPPAPYQTESQFEELGVGGTQLFDISKAYRFDFAGDSGIRNTRLDTRIISDANRDVSIFGPYGIVGMPAMTDRVTTLDFTPWTTIVDLELYMKVEFGSEVPEYNGPRYSIKVDNRHEYHPEPHVLPLGNPPPAWADIPFLSAEMLHNGQVSSGNFLFDTGAQVSILNSRMAFELGLDTNSDGLLDQRDASFARFETVGGIGGTKTVPVFLIDEVHVPSEQGPDLVWTDLQWLVLDIDPGIDAVFGFDNMTSGWIDAVAVNGKSGYIMQSHLDFRGYETTGQGRIYLDINPEIHAVVDPQGPGAIVVESGEITSISETGVTDSYTVRLATQPTAPVRVNLTSPGDQQATAVDAANPSRDYLEFTPQNWNVPQTVRVAAVDDTTEESFHRSFIRHNSTSSDPAYQGVGMPRVVVNITDNDFPGVMLIPSSGSTDVSEAGASDTYQIVLTYPPTAPVTITLQNVQNQVTATALAGGGNTLTFTPQNWNIPQSVLVTAVDDALVEGPHRAYISHSFTTADTNFQQAFILQEVVQISDNDGGDSKPPRVERVIVASSTWGAEFIDAVDGGGLGAGNGLGVQLTSPDQLLPWANIDRVYIQFSEDVRGDVATAIELRDSQALLPRTVTYDAQNFMATLALTTPVSFAKLGLAVSDVLTDAAGNRLDGDDSQIAGGAFWLRFDVLAGDGDRNGRVTAADLIGFSAAFNHRTTTGSYDAAYDWNADGRITAADLVQFSAHFNWQLASLSDPASPLASAATRALGDRFVRPRRGVVDEFFAELDTSLFDS